MVNLEKIKNREINPDRIIGSKKAKVAVSTNKIPKTSRLMFITPCIISVRLFSEAGTSSANFPINKPDKSRHSMPIAAHPLSDENLHRNQTCKCPLR
jgi:hypothetical protein